MAGNNDVIIVDPPNWPHTVPFQHVTNNAKSKSSGFGRGYSNTPADHDVVDFRKGDGRNYSKCCKRAICVFLYLRPQL